jgi:predicted PurR-regulated permease PerM
MVMKDRKSKRYRSSEAQGGLYTSNEGSGILFRKTFIQTITVLIIVLLALLAGKMIYIFLLFFAGIMLAVLLNFIGMQFMHIRWVPHWLAITLALIILTIVVVLIIMMVVPLLAEKMEDFVSQLEKSILKLKIWLKGNEGGRFLLMQIFGMEDKETNGELWTRVTTIFSTTVGALTGLVIVIIVGIFLAYSPGLYKSGFLHLVPVNLRDRAVEVITEMGIILRWWLLGQLISMTVLLISTWIMLALLKVPMAPLLALLTGLLTFIPYLGPLIALVPIILMAYLESPLLAIYVFILYMLIQNMEANVLMPIIFHRTVHIPPAIGVISQILFGSLMGFLGFVLAIPLTAVILQFVKMVYVEDVLGDDNVDNVPKKA